LVSLDGSVVRGVSAGPGHEKNGTPLWAVSDARRRRRELIDAVSAGRADPGRAAALISQDSAKLDAVKAHLENRRCPPARLALVKVHPAGWRFPLWLPIPLFAARYAVRLAGRYVYEEAGYADLQAVARAMACVPRCGKVIEVQDEGTEVKVWLL